MKNWAVLEAGCNCKTSKLFSARKMHESSGDLNFIIVFPFAPEAAGAPSHRLGPGGLGGGEFWFKFIFTKMLLGFTSR